MNITDLHEEFLKALHSKLPRKDIVNSVADMLMIEKDAAYRRVSGKVNFSAREIGIIAGKLNISLDQLMQNSEQYISLPFMLASPLKVRSMDPLFETIELSIKRITSICDEQTESGNIYHNLPLEFCLASPLLIKFMFFKWGNYFVGTEEFDIFSRWELPHQVAVLCEKLKIVSNIDRIFYVWDEMLIWTLVREIAVLHRMHAITTEERDEIKQALKELLLGLEHTLNGGYATNLSVNPEMAFYVSTINLGFTNNYFSSAKGHFFAMHTNFNFSMVNDCPVRFAKIKQWIDSFRDISIHLSGSGRVERRLFFEEQYRIIDQIED